MSLDRLVLSLLVGTVQYFLYTVSEEYCHDYLVSGPLGIPNSAFQCSSVGSTRYQRIYFIRLFTTYWIHYAAGAWCAKEDDTDMWYQVDLGEDKLVKGVVTRGSSNGASFYAAYVTSYQLSYRLEDGVWNFVNFPNGTIKTFAGNEHYRQTLINMLPESVIARYVKIHIKTFEKRCCLQFDVLGCPAESKTKSSKNKKWRASLFGIHNPTSGLIWKEHSKNQGFCAQSCFQDPSCLSFAFNTVEEQCQGHDGQLIEDLSSKRQSLIWYQRAYSECMYGYQPWKSGFCYKVYTLSVVVTEADSICRRNGAYLCQMTSINDTVTMWEATRSNAILNSKNTFYVDGRYENGTNSWWFQSGVDLLRAVNASSDPTGGHCVHLTDGTVKVGSCTETHWFICTHVYQLKKRENDEP